MFWLRNKKNISLLRTLNYIKACIPLFAEVALQHVSMVLRSEKQWDVVEALPDMGNYPVNILPTSVVC